MKKIYFLLLLLIFGLSNSRAQCTIDPNDDICRGVFAGLLFEILYQEDNVFNYLPAYYPSPYIDLQEMDPVTAKLKVLSYLQFDNGFSVFDYSLNPAYVFRPLSEITKIEATVFILEAYNISPDYSGSSPFDDIDEDDPIFGYANRAYDEGFVDIQNGDFDPYDNFTVQETIEFLDALINSPYHPIDEDLTAGSNYLQPGIYNPLNIAQARGVNQGVFNHYAKNSFVIPDVKFSLDFSHFYSSSMVELPEGFFKLKPLGTGWSHTYNAYIIRENNVGEDEIDYYFIVWPDGTIHIFNEDEEEYESMGVYDEFNEFNGGDEIRIRKKNQMDYRFEQLDSSEDIWYLIYIEDPNGNRITIEYETSDVDNDLRRIEYVEAPSDKKLFFHYTNNTDYLSSLTDPIGREIFFDVDENNDERLEKFTDAKGNETRYKYIENDENAPLADQKKRFLLDEIILPRGNKITAEYDSDNVKLESYQIDDQPPVSIYLDFDFSDQQQFATVSTPVDNNSDFTEEYEFNINGLITNYSSDTDDIEVDYPNSGVNIMLPTDINLNGVEIEYEYDNRGNVTEINKENGDVVEEFDYDNDNNLTRYTDANGNETNFDYDSDENLTDIHYPIGNSMTFTYDSNGQMLSQTNPEGIITTYTYENDGAVSSVSMPEGISTVFTYDGVNRLLIKNSNGLISTYDYDPNDNITSSINSGGFVTSYDYDANDNLETITNANNITTSFTYDDKDRVTHEQFGELVKQYDYTDEGYLERYTKPSGAEIDYEYDNDGRLKETGTITDIDYNNRNLVESIANDDSRYNFEYDNLNRLDEVFDEFNDAIISYGYDDLGNIEEIEYPIGNINLRVFYNYDEKNRMTRVRVNIDGNFTTIAEYEYRDDDLLEEVVYGNDIRSRFFYDNAGRKTGVNHSNLTSGNYLYFEGATLNERGNIITDTKYYSVEEVPYEIGNTDTYNYSYDDNNHLTTAFGLPVAVNDDGNTISREISLTGGGTSEVSYFYDIDDRLNLISASGIAYYPVTYIYDPYGNRISKNTLSGNHLKNYTWDIVNNNVILEESNSSQDIFHIYGVTGLEVSILGDTGEILYYYLGDLRGSVVATVQEDNNNYFINKYDDFGNLTYGQFGASPQGYFKYLGKYGITLEQPELGHYYIKARHYDAKIGRFLTEDPIWSTNLYPYADNNPISNIDPSGKIGIYALYNGSLGDKFYQMGYGDAANYLSASNNVWEYAISNPIEAGAIIGLGSGFAAAGFATAAGSAYAIGSGAAATPSSIAGQGLQFYLGVKSGKEAIDATTNKLTFNSLNISDKNSDYLNLTKFFLPKFISELGAKGKALIKAYELLTIFY